MVLSFDCCFRSALGFCSGLSARFTGATIRVSEPTFVRNSAIEWYWPSTVTL